MNLQRPHAVIYTRFAEFFYYYYYYYHRHSDLVVTVPSSIPK